MAMYISISVFRTTFARKDELGKKTGLGRNDALCQGVVGAKRFVFFLFNFEQF